MRPHPHSARFFGAAIAGHLADRIGRTIVFAVDLGMLVLFALLSALAPTVTVLVVFYVVEKRK